MGRPARPGVHRCARGAGRPAGGRLRGRGSRTYLDRGPIGDFPSRDATFSFHAYPAPSLAHFECRLDGGAWRRCSSPVTYTGLIGGPHRFEVRLIGLLDNAAPIRRDWLVAVPTETLPCTADASKCPNPLPRAKKPRARPDRRRDADGCAYAANRPGEVPLARLERAVICLFGNLRRDRGQQALRANPALARAAGAHGRDMVVNRYFAHTSLLGQSPTRPGVAEQPAAPRGDLHPRVQAGRRGAPARQPRGGKRGITAAANLGRKG